jgi:hypothetical protein
MQNPKLGDTTGERVMTLIDLERAALRQALRLGHSWVGPEHGLLALAQGADTDLARRALDESGMEAAAIEAQFVGCLGTDVPLPATEITPNPAWYRLVGRAEGLASTLGTGEVQPVDLLIAMAWDSRPWLLDSAATKRQRVIEALERLGVRVPSSPLPVWDVKRFTKRVDFPLRMADRVLAVLKERFPPGSESSFLFNHDEIDRAWVLAEDEIELEEIVNDVLQSDRGE